MVWSGAVLCEQEFEPDEMKKSVCNDCNLCVDICPVNALRNSEIDQQSCWDFAFGDEGADKILDYYRASKGAFLCIQKNKRILHYGYIIKQSL